MIDGISGLRKKSFASPDETKHPFEKGTIEVLTVGGMTFNRETLEPGCR